MYEKTYPICALGRSTIYLGRQLDHKVLKILFDVQEWLEKWPGATVAGFAIPPVGEGYPIALEIDGNVAVWTIRDSDTATAGHGMVQLVLLGKNGEKLHSANAATQIGTSAAASAGDKPPDAAKPWFEELLEKIRQLEENGVTDEQIGEALDEYLKEHPIGGVKPEDVEEAVRTALKEAKDSGEFDGKDGEAGAPGEAATFEITGAESLPYGSKPTVTEDAGSTAQNRKYKLGIPEGAPGTPGSGNGGSVELDSTLKDYSKAANAGAVGNALEQEKQAREDAVSSLSDQITAQKEAKVNQAQGVENAGKLLYINADGLLVPLALGDGLDIVNGVLRITAEITPDTQIIFEDAGGGVVTMSGAEFTDQGDGTVLIGNASFTDQGNGVVLFS